MLVHANVSSSEYYSTDIRRVLWVIFKMVRRPERETDTPRRADV
jgi:hypothetical protein